MQSADIGMIERRYGMGFPLKTLAELGLGNLHSDGSVQASVARFVYVAHATSADGCNDFVGAEFVAYRQRHLSSAKFSRSGSGLCLDIADDSD